MATKISLNINEETKAAIEQLKDSHEVTATEVIRRAVLVYKFLEDATSDGQVIEIVNNKTNTIQQVHIL